MSLKTGEQKPSKRRTERKELIGKKPTMWKTGGGVTGNKLAIRDLQKSRKQARSNPQRHNGEDSNPRLKLSEPSKNKAQKQAGNKASLGV